MKKTYLLVLLALCLMPLLSSGQGLKGSFLLGGALNYTSGPSEYQTGPEKMEASSFTIQPIAGYFVHDRWVLGPMFSYSKEKQDIATPFYGSGNNLAYIFGSLRTTSHEIGGFTRYYHPLSPNFYVFGHLRGGSATTKTGYEGARREEATLTSYFGELSLGFTYLPLQWMGVELSAGEARYDFLKGQETKSFTAQLNSSTFKIGVSFYVGRASASVAE